MFIRWLLGIGLAVGAVLVGREYARQAMVNQKTRDPLGLDIENDDN